MASRTTSFLSALLALTLVSCAAPPGRPQPLPPALGLEARIPGIPAARQWGDEVPEEFEAWLALPDRELQARYGGIIGRQHDYLVISGGGSNGAFGAGLLVGWSEAGTRPEFQIVTGVSTGALIAPFAFLGSTYDQRLKEVYTRFSTRDLIEERGLWSVLRGDSAVSTKPLRGLIAEYVDDTVIAAIAQEGGRGRSLLIGTTHLDAARPVIWDITRIAASGAPGSRKLIRDVILASASIPGAFPPVLIEVEARGRTYDEIHVDGGVTAQLFLSAPGLDWSRIFERLQIVGRPNLYIIRNAKMRSDWQNVPLRLAPLISRTLESLIRAQGIGDLGQLYIASGQHALNYHLAYIPTDFSAESNEMFDQVYMGKLFELGYERGRQGYPWLVPNTE